MSKLRHIAVIVEDPEASAKFFEEAFDMKRAGTARRGIYMSDGIFNVALLKKEGDEKLGLYHFGMWVDDLDAAEKKVVDAGGKYLAGRPTTPNFFDHIGLYAKMEPRGLIAPKFQYWDRQDNALIAEFDHALLKADTRFPYVLQCERIKIIEEALAMAKAHPLIAVRMATEFVSFEQSADVVFAQVKNAAGDSEAIK